MRVLVLLIFIGYFLFGCKRTEPYFSLELIFQNQSGATVRTNKYVSRVDTVVLLMFELNDYETYTDVITYDGNPPTGFIDYHSGIEEYFISDSIQVVFYDSLPVTHLNRAPSLNYSNISTETITYEEPRNICNSDNYMLEKVSDKYYRATYTFTDADLDYAVEINE